MRTLTITGETIARMDRWGCTHDYLAIRIKGFLERGELLPSEAVFIPSYGYDVGIDRAMEVVQAYRAMAVETLGG